MNLDVSIGPNKKGDQHQLKLGNSWQCKLLNLKKKMKIESLFLFYSNLDLPGRVLLVTKVALNIQNVRIVFFKHV